MNHLIVSLRLLLIMSILTGGLYTALVTGLSSAVFPKAAAGSLVVEQAGTVGSDLIGRTYDAAGLFWGRPSATGPDAYRGDASSGSNLGPTSPDLDQLIRERVARLRASDPGQSAPIPIDLVTASGSGLDPHISPAAALWQVPRVARERGVPIANVQRLVDARIEHPTFGILGAPRVNVRLLNRDLGATAP